MKDYFNSALGCQLLYKFERAQYADLLSTNPGVSVSKLYGPIHLLRWVPGRVTRLFIIKSPRSF